MNALHSQPSLFDPDQHVDRAQADTARTRMRDMISRLSGTSTPPWKDQMAAILDEGAFQRAMRYLPQEEAQRLWGEFDMQMERLYTIWSAAQPPPNN